MTDPGPLGTDLALSFGYSEERATNVPINGSTELSSVAPLFLSRFSRVLA
jgi:hypothetical protein